MGFEGQDLGFPDPSSRLQTPVDGPPHDPYSVKPVLTGVLTKVLWLSLLALVAFLVAGWVDPPRDRAVDTAVLVLGALAIVAALRARSGLVELLTGYRRWIPPAGVAALGTLELIDGDPSDRRLVLAMIGIGISAAVADARAALAGTVIAVGLHLVAVVSGAIDKSLLDTATSAGLVMLFGAGATSVQRWLSRLIRDEPEVEEALAEGDRGRAEGAVRTWTPVERVLRPRVATTLSWRERVALLTPVQLAVIGAYAQGARSAAEAVRLSPAAIREPAQAREQLKSAQHKTGVHTIDGLVAMVENVKLLE